MMKNQMGSFSFSRKKKLYSILSGENWYTRQFYLKIFIFNVKSYNKIKICFGNRDIGQVSNLVLTKAQNYLCIKLIWFHMFCFFFKGIFYLSIMYL